MTSSIKHPSARAGGATAEAAFKPFLDENGEPSDRSGPDLTKAEPIADVIARLRRMRRGFAAEFLRQCEASGIYLSVCVFADHSRLEPGGRLYMGRPCDTQEELREPRFQALSALLGQPGRLAQVVDLVNRIGRFVDNRPYASVREAADHFLSAGGRIMVRLDGKREESLPLNDEQIRAEARSGYPLRRMVQRYHATLLKREAREEMVELVRAQGKRHEGSGWIVLETGGRADA